MALNANNVVVGITGKVYVGPTDTTAPTSASSQLDADFVDLGYVSADGVTFSTDRSTNQIRAWQNADLVREVVTEGTTTYQFTLLESTLNSVAAYFGTEVDNSGKIQLVPTATGGRKSFVIDVVDGADVVRHYVPFGEVLNIESQQIQNGEAITYGMTVTAYVKDGRAADIWYSKFD
jgi:hypothetical protein